MKTRKIHFFNMIEILLAMTVIAIGMTSILGLFPVGLNASRNAIAQNMSSDVADQMVTYMRVMGESSQTAYASTFTNPTTNLPNYDNDSDTTNNTSKDNLDIYTSGDVTTVNLEDSSDENVQTLSDAFLDAYKENKVGISNDTPPDDYTSYIFRRVAPDWAIFTKKPTSTTHRRRIYFVVQGPNCTKDGGNRSIDYSAMVLVWKSGVRIKRLESDGTTWSLWPDATAAANCTYSGKVNIELSWPLEQPYKDRKKRYYQVIITKPSS